MINSIEQLVIIAGVLIIAYFILLSFLPSKKLLSHRQNIRLSKKVLKKIKKFEGHEKEKLIFGYLRSYRVTPYVFEELILTVLENAGVKVFRGASYSGDGGLDGRFKYKGHLYAIQAKLYSDHIHKNHLVKFGNDVAKFPVSGGIFVHSGKTRPVHWEACPENVKIISGTLLIKFLLGECAVNHLIPTRSNRRKQNNG